MLTKNSFCHWPIHVASLYSSFARNDGPGESVAAVQQVDQLVREILLLERPIEKENIGVVVFNYEDLRGDHNRCMFQSYSPGGRR